LRAVLSRNVG